VAAVLIGMAFVLRLVLRLNDVGAIPVFVLTPTRMDALLAGSFTALLLRGPSPTPELARFARLALAAGTVLTGAAIVIEQNTGSSRLLMQTIGFSGVCLLGSALILMTQTADPGSLLRRALRARWLVFFGTYSYGLYVLHRVAIELVFTWLPSVESFPTIGGLLFPWALLRGLCAIALALVFALLSWHLLEKHFLAMKGRFRYGAPIVPVGAPVVGIREENSQV
jgi:peptidoglycan/LPS O-acetylase OafA/YrhL